MTDTTTAIINELRDPKLRVVARNLRSMLQLTVARVAAHHAAPAAISVPAGGLEATLAARFAAMPADRQRRSAERATALLAGADRTVRFGPAGAASLRSNLPIADQVRERMAPRELGLTSAYLESVHDAGVATPGFRPLTTLDKLELRLHQVRCVDETDPEFASRDYMLMGGTAISGAGATTKVGQFTVGTGFDDGTTKRFDPPRQVVAWNLTQGAAWPKTYFFTMVICEKDNGGFPDFLDKLSDDIKKEVVAILTGVAGAIGLVGGPLGAAVGAMLGWAVGEAYTMLKDWWEDDEFPPQTISCTQSSLASRFAGGATDSAESTLTFKGHGGTYQVTYDWRLFA